jgi:hypothetical protein
MLTRTAASISATALAIAVAERSAHAAPPACSSLPTPILYIEAGDTQEPLLKTLGQKLRNSPQQPMTVVYNTTGSCTLIQDMYTPNKLSVNLKYVPSTQENVSWDPSQPSLACTPDPDGTPIDLAISALFVQSCTQQSPPQGLGLITGPIQGYGFVVPKASTQTAIVAEEAYFTFGFGNNGQIEPWHDESFMFIRPTTKSTLLTLAANIGVPGAKWKGQQLNASSDVLNAVSTSTTPEPTIGILGMEIFDANRSKVNVLAFRAYEQKHAFWPDSTPTAFDKQNLRDGHYLPWSPTVYITAVDSNNVPTNPRAKYFVDLVLGRQTSSPTDVNGLSAVIATGLVPDCAMRVTRSFDGGDLSLYSPAEPCHCFFESSVGPNPQAPAGCVACQDDSACNGGKCRHGYCEAK